MLEAAASGGDCREPAARHVAAVGEVEVLELGASGGEPGVRAAVKVEVLEAGVGDRRAAIPATVVLRLFYGCSYRFHLSGDGSDQKWRSLFW